MAKVQEELGKFFKTFTSGFDNEQFNKFVEDAERIMGRPAGLLLQQVGLNAATNTPFTLLDHACGTGPIAAHLYKTVDKRVLSQSKIVCADINANLIAMLKRRAEENSWSNVEATVLDAQKPEFPEKSFSYVTIGFAMHVVRDPGAVLQDAMRILQPGGVLAFSVWHKDNTGWVPDMRSSFETLPFEGPLPSTIPMAPNGWSEFTDPDAIPELLSRYGFQEVKVQTVEDGMRVENAEDYLRSFGMMRDWVVQSYWSEESKDKAKGMLDEHIVRHLTEKHNGQPWDLKWRAILVTSQKPGN